MVPSVVVAVLLVVRWHLGDAHGALLMFAVWSVGVLSLSIGSSGVDAIYGGYHGLMAPAIPHGPAGLALRLSFVSRALYIFFVLFWGGPYHMVGAKGECRGSAPI